MDQTSITDPTPAQAPSIRDRRRPGLIKYTTSDLIALLREPSGISASEIEEGDPLAPARGVVVGFALAAPVWIGIGLLVWNS
jgi:hypothetical protein